MEKIDIDINKLKEELDEQPRKKKAVQNALDFDRSTMSKVLTNKRKIEGGELLTVASILNRNPFDFVLKN